MTNNSSLIAAKPTTAKVKLLLIIPNRGLGGAQRVFHDHSVALREFYDVTEVIFNEDDPDLYPSGNPVCSLGVEGGGSPLAKIKNFYRRVDRLKALKKELQCDVAISHLEGADYVNLLSKGRERVLLLIHGSKLHDGNINGTMGWLRKRLLIPWLYRRADKIVTVSRDLIPEMTESLGIPTNRVQAITNSFDVAKVRAQSLEPLDNVMQAVYAAAPVLVTSGRLTIQKNQAPLLDILAKLLRRRPVKLVFIGDGELREELVQHALKLGLRVYQAWNKENLTIDYDVYFVGLQSNPFKYIRPARLFAFPSAWEGYPMALGEAMACGAVCVAADCPTGPREMLAPDSVTPNKPISQAEYASYGVLMPMLKDGLHPGSSYTCWIDTFDQLLSDTQFCQQLGSKAYQQSLNFSHSATFGRWRQLIDSSIQGVL